MGIEIDILWLTVLMFSSLAVFLMAGLPLSFVTGGLGCIFLFVFGTSSELNILPSRIFPFMTDYQLSAIPLFIFMATMLERAGLIQELFDVVYKILGGLRGGLASATIISSTILAAMVGVIGAAEVAMGILALPAMLKRKYDSELACGSILAGGTLGILIPPSILAILFAVVAQQSVGDLFIGAIFPGLLLSGLYVAYVTARCYINPQAGPALPLEERVSIAEKIRLLGGIITPILLIVLVLGVIFTGVATPVEAAGIGTFGAIFVAAMHRRLSWPAVREAALTTLKASAMVLWIIFGASIFVGFYILKGGQQFVADTLIGTGLGPYGILLVMMIILIILGMFLDWVGILLLAVPIFMPILLQMEFNGLFGFAGPTAGISDPGKAREAMQLWFGVVYMVNMQMSFLSPPFGYALFYLKSVAPPEIGMATIFRSAIPFLILQALGLFFCIVFPQLILWLPQLVYG
ncbi:MAG: TRAP transporter large permease [Hyphomicrobiales bacterium]